MSKLASKLSRQILAVLLSIAMIMPNMTAYASEVSGSDSILPASEVVEADDTSAESDDTSDETDVEESIADDAQPSDTEDELPGDEDETINVGEEGDLGETDESDVSEDEDVSEAGDVTVDSDVQEPEAEKPLMDQSARTIPTSWSFHNNSTLMGNENGSLIQGGKGNVDGLIIDATNGKFDSKSRTDWAQINTGTIIKVPVEGLSKVTVVGYEDSNTTSKYTVDDNDNAAAEATFICAGKAETIEEISGKWVTIEWKCNSYIGSINVEPIVLDKDILPTSDVTESTNISFTSKFSGHANNDPVNDINEIAVKNITYHDSNGSHGLQTTEKDAVMVVKIPANKKADIAVLGCQYGTKPDKIAAVNSDGSVFKVFRTSSTEGYQSGKAAAYEYTVLGAEGTVTLFFDNGMFIHNLKVVEFWGTDVTAKYTIKVTADDKQGSASAGKPFAAKDEEVTLTATPKSGYAFKEWKAVKGNVTSFDGNKFTMPASDVEIQAVFEESGPRTEWDFRKTDDTTLYNGNNTFQSSGTKTGELAGLQIDATNGKFGPNNSGFVQINANTKIKVPVTGIETDDGVKVTLQWNQPGAVYTVADSDEITSVKQKPQSVYCKGTEETKEDSTKESYVEIVVTNAEANASGTYLELIKVEPVYYAPSGETPFGSLTATADLTEYVKKGIEINDFTPGNSHGLNAGAKASMVLHLEAGKKADVTVLTCRYGSNGVTVTDSNGSELKLANGTVIEGNQDDNAPAPKLTALGAEGEITLAIGKGTFIHSITVDYYDKTAYKDKYTVTVDVAKDANNKTNGTANVEKAYYAKDDEVTLTVTPEPGYAAEIKLIEDIENGNEIAGVTVANNKFTMPDKDVKVEVTFKATGTSQSITVVETVPNGSAEAGNHATAVSGTTVDMDDVAVATPNTGYELKEWKVTYTDENSQAQEFTVTKKDGKYSFTMPKADITITPVFQVLVVKYFTTTDFFSKKGGGAPVDDVDGLTVISGITYHDTQHGLGVDSGGSMKLNLEPGKKYNLTVWGCEYGKGATVKAAYNNGTDDVVVDLDKEPDVDLRVKPGAPEKGPKFTLLNTQGEVTLTFSGGASYVHSISVEESSGVTQYKVTVTAGENGTAKASSLRAPEGDEITLTAEPDSHYKIDSRNL